ncbi:hypothetical protein DERP_013534 [Dermatophagoides pteronyssinus]|uniref:Uncharacterized protein n=1 Tax=Dermatophagoides pteronyssinus TaxID=6956 RepID=A0ABQ8IXM1_DERPT|nr:hypothetical protein DERP_013534 [Dermatophagoides pteronyssinus]
MDDHGDDDDDVKELIFCLFHKESSKIISKMFHLPHGGFSLHFRRCTNFGHLRPPFCGFNLISRRRSFLALPHGFVH